MRGEFIDVAGTRLYYYAAGTRGSGDPMLLLHGVPVSGHLWSDVVPLLPQGYRIIVLDLLGCGRSDQSRAASFGIAAHAERVMAVLDVLHVERACIVGHGVGAAIAQSIAVHHPERVSRLALINAVCFSDWPDRKLRALRACLPLLRALPPRMICDAVERRLLAGHADAARGARAVTRFMRAYTGTTGRDALLHHLRDLHAADTAALAPALPGVRVPTAVLHGERDPYCPLERSRHLAYTIPNASLETIEDAGHYLPDEAPVRVADAIARLLSR